MKMLEKRWLMMFFKGTMELSLLMVQLVLVKPSLCLEIWLIHFEKESSQESVIKFLLS